MDPVPYSRNPTHPSLPTPVQEKKVLPQTAFKYPEIEQYEDAFKINQELAGRGDIEAKYQLSIAYRKGQGTSTDNALAFSYCKQAADAAHPEANYDLGRMYYFGTGVEKDIAMTIKYYTVAAEKGEPTAQCSLGYLYEQGIGFATSDVEKARALYQQAKQQGDARATFYLGKIYKKEGNLNEAFQHFQMAANQDYPSAINDLALSYERGVGVEKNTALAIELYIKAANKGCEAAQCNIGRKYLYGEEVEKDLKKALYYYKLAANQGNAEVLHGIGIWYTRSGPDQNLKEAIEHLKKSTNKGYSKAINDLGMIYASPNLGITEDPMKAAELFAKAAEKKCQVGLHNIGLCYKNGYGVPQNMEKAASYAEQVTVEVKNKDIFMWS